MNKYDVIAILDELKEGLQTMRENGETDLRGVLHRIDIAIQDVKALEDE